MNDRLGNAKAKISSHKQEKKQDALDANQAKEAAVASAVAAANRKNTEKDLKLRYEQREK